jgi:histidinol-phosphate aminotransferase
VEKYDNLLVTRTFSKSRSLAGARLGYGIGSPSLIRDLVNIKYSTNPYNVNRMTAMAGIGSIEDDKYFKENIKAIIENREFALKELEKLGFTATQSKTNFIFVKSDKIGGEELYLRLKEKGILVRHFTNKKIKDYNRITVGSMAEMQALITAVEDILEV